MANCILIALLTLLELFNSKEHTENTDFAFGIHGQNDPILAKEKADNFMKRILNEYGLSSILEGKRGTHSIIKMTKNKSQNMWVLKR